MLVALDGEGRLVSVLEEVVIDKQAEFFCPACHGRLRLKRGQVKRAYFAHVNLRDCQFTWENESEEHLSLKADLYRSLSRKGHPVLVEKLLPEIQQIADLLVLDRLALEVQCSPLSQKRLEERSLSYRKTGYQVRWLLGEKLWLRESLSPLQCGFLYFSQNMGFHLWELDVKKQCLRLKYLIYEDWHGKAHYLVKECPFSGDILAFLRLPYQKQALSSYHVKIDKKLLTYIQQQLRARNPKWLKRQEEAYLKGENLLTKDLSAYYPQVRIPKGHFYQIEQTLEDFEEAFMSYYQACPTKDYQVLYPPAFYGKMRS